MTQRKGTVMQNSQELNAEITSIDIETYSKFNAEIARIKSDFESSKKATDALSAKLAEAIERKRVFALPFLTAEFAELGINLSELTDSRKANQKKVTSIAPRYRNPETGETWSGRGNAPKWIDGQDRNQYLIAEQAPSAIADSASEQVVTSVANMSPCPTVDAIDRREVSPTAVPASLSSPYVEPAVLDKKAVSESALIDQMQRDEAMA
jgi:DNA-binding protein H-NS